MSEILAKFGFFKNSKNEFWYCWVTEFSVQNILLHTQIKFGILSIDYHKNRQKIPILSMLNSRLKCPRFNDMGIIYNSLLIRTIFHFVFKVWQNLGYGTYRSSVDSCSMYCSMPSNNYYQFIFQLLIFQFIFFLINQYFIF